MMDSRIRKKSAKKSPTSTIQAKIRGFAGVRQMPTKNRRKTKPEENGDPDLARYLAGFIRARITAGIFLSCRPPAPPREKDSGVTMGRRGGRSLRPNVGSARTAGIGTATYTRKTKPASRPQNLWSIMLAERLRRGIHADPSRLL